MKQSGAFNFRLVLLVSLPSLVFYGLFLHHHYYYGGERGGEGKGPPSAWNNVCEWGGEHPWYLLNVLFLLNVDVLFWIIGILQGSFWLIDPYWTIIPVLIVHFFEAHPSSETNRYRSRVVILLIWSWSIRLTVSYLRREEWRWGEREDWRFAALRKQHGKQWWWMSFFAVFLSQHMFLIGLTLPLYSIYHSQLPWNAWDFLATAICSLGIVVAHLSDTQLYDYVSMNKRQKDVGEPMVPVLDKGLWYYSRHPNYFGEQTFWWGLSLFAWNVGQGWAVIGTMINSACLAYVTVLVERKMTQVEWRAQAYRDYQKSTSVLIPFFKFSRGKHNNRKVEGKSF